MTGLSTALSEITLVAFTTLAPGGAVAFAIIAAMLAGGCFSEAQQKSVKKYLSIPLVTAMVGLVASATHLGNPANALYVFMGVGRSPLSNEVFTAVVFLGLAGLYWLYSFTEKQRPLLERVWLALAALAAIVFVCGISLAYSVDTIITWNSPLMPLALWLNALVGGAALTVLSLRGAIGAAMPTRWSRALGGMFAAALAANVIVLFLYNGDLASMGNSMADALDLVPAYGAFIIGYAVLALAGACSIAVAERGYTGVKTSARRCFAALICGCIFIFAGIFIIRFAFYMLHMTVGLAV